LPRPPYKKMLSENYLILIVCNLQQRGQSLRSLVHTLGKSNTITITDYEHALAIIKLCVPHIVILDNSFSGLDVSGLLAGVRSAYPNVRCIVLDNAPHGASQTDTVQADSIQMDTVQMDTVQKDITQKDTLQPDAVLNSELPIQHLLAVVRQQMSFCQKDLIPARHAG
jgi:hypothetical protein